MNEHDASRPKYLFLDTSDNERDRHIADAYHVLEGPDEPVDFARLHSRIVHAARPRLIALLHRPERTALDYAASWARFAAPLAIAASLLIGVAIARSPSFPVQRTPVLADADVGAVLFGVMTRNVRTDDAVATLASEGSGLQLWPEMAQ